MRKRGRIKYLLVISICLSVFIYGFILININKAELVKKKSKFIINLKLNPIDFRIETNSYVFYVNDKIIYNMKEKCIDTFNGIFLK
ncbi:hypothetical protein LGK95_03225 [Clostridium algoriphilum]|uniref:hypothetical protein n=1 Tax=Clostridium algoriphilum TaxID=198347 RepID=UPI001CF10D08|nr:hypothetical protein [Clostridium algoriphilum]MCB2292552.1 hypothetical protein [Clostridium algoriphilum]